MEDTIISTIQPDVNGNGGFCTNHLEIEHRLHYFTQGTYIGWVRDIYKVDINDVAGNMFTCVSESPIVIHRIADKADGMVRVKAESNHDTLIEWLIESVKRALAGVRSRHYVHPVQA